MKKIDKKRLPLLPFGVRLVVLLFMGGCLGFSINKAFGVDLHLWQSVGRLLEGIVIILTAFMLQIVMHELGHLLAGLMRGWSFMSFMILGLVFSRKEGGFHLSRFAVPGIGGQCLMIPPEKGDTDWGVIFYHAGGVLMNLLIILVSGILWVYGHGRFIWEGNLFLVSLAVIGLFFVLRNGIPSTRTGTANDGKNIIEFRRDPYSSYVFLKIMSAMGKMKQGHPVEEVIDGYLTEGVKIDYSNPIHVIAVNFDVSLAISRLDFERAHSLFRQLAPYQGKINPIYQKELLYEKVFLFLVDPRDGVDVGPLIDLDSFKYFEMQAAFRPTSLRVKYTFARLYECDEQKAAVIYEQFQKACSEYYVPGEVVSEKRLVEYVRSLEPYES